MPCKTSISHSLAHTSYYRDKREIKQFTVFWNVERRMHETGQQKEADTSCAQNIKGCSYPQHEGVCGSRTIAPFTLKLGTWLRWVINFTPRSIYPPERNPSTHQIGGWVGSRNGLEALKKKEIYNSCWQSNHDSSDIQTVKYSLVYRLH
jgi:hypothetical protein